MQNRKAGMQFILITILLDMVGIGLIIPVLPRLVTTMYGGTLSDGSFIFGWFVASYALMQFVCAPILGKLSDQFGRRPIVLISLFGAGLDYLFMAFAPNLKWLFVGRVISGITGANISAANAYIADVSTAEDRAKNFGMLGACFGVGFIIGPALGGVLGEYGYRLPFIVAACLNLLNWLYGFFVLPESHAKENRRPFDWKTANPFAALSQLGKYPVVLGLTATIALERLAHDTLPATWVLYTTYRFNWSELDNGLSLALVGIMFAIVSAGFTGRIVGWLGERRAIIYGLMIGSMTFVIYGLSTRGWMLYVGIIFGSIGGFAGAAIQSLITKMVAPTEQGAVQGIIASIQSVMAILGPLMATNLFGYFTSTKAPVKLPGAAFLAAALLVALSALMAARSARQPANAEATQTS
ncbi:MAG: TCR/Tet family MFS transporter [Blastocatellia bacterium]